jgi:transposase
MLTVDQYNYIRTSHRVYGKKIREIARDTNHSRNTVKKALRGEHEGYNPRRSQPYPVLGPYLAIIDRWLSSDKDKPKKQRHTAKRIYDRLCHEHGYVGSDRTVRKYVRVARMRLGINGGQVFIPLEANLGFEAEVDWGRCHAVLGSEYTLLKIFCMRSKGSGKHFVQCFPCERQQALFEGHIRAFNFFGVVFSTLVYDNLSTAVDKILRGKKRKLHESYLKFQGYYNFKPLFCNPGQGHEKGGVEGLVGYCRRNYMVPIPEAENLEALNQRLLEQSLAYGNHRMAGREKTVNELYEEERKHLLPLPDIAFSNLETYSGKVDKYSTVIIDKNRYSVPNRYVGVKVRAVAYMDHVDIFYGSQKVGFHPRVYGNNKWQLDPFHYLDLISKRPLAFETARAIKQWRKKWPVCLENLLEQFYQKHGHSKGTKEFIKVLWLYKEHEEKDVTSAVEAALLAGVGCSEAVEHILANRTDSGKQTFVPLNNWQTFPPPDVSVYDRIGGDL